MASHTVYIPACSSADGEAVLRIPYQCSHVLLQPWVKSTAINGLVILSA